MKKIKLLLITISVVFSVQAFAQMKIGIKAGGNVCNMKFDIDKDFGHEPETKSKMGFHAGLISDITLIEESLSLQPALLYTNKGFSINLKEELEEVYEYLNPDIDDVEGYIRFNYNYIELPIMLVYKNSGFQASFGPYFAIGIGGKYKQDFSFELNGQDMDAEDVFYPEDSYKLKPVYGKVDDDTYDDYVDDDDVLDLYRAFDFGLNLGVGYQVNKVLFNVGYSFGLINMTPNYDADEFNMDEDYTEGFIQKNRVFSFSISVFFN